MEQRQEDGPFDPDRFLDRHDARHRFSSLTQFQGRRRLLAICARGGAGKSDLLRRFEWTCDVPEAGGPSLPVSRVPLDEVEGGRVVDLVYQIRSDLGDGLDWGAFDAVRSRWLKYDWNLLDEQYGQTLIDNRGADIKDSPRFIGINIENPTNVNVMGDRRWTWPTKYHEDEVNKIYVRAFCADLKRNADREPVVLLFDAYEKAALQLKEWVGTFIDSHCLDQDQRPGYLAIVLAGRQVPPLRAKLRDRFDELVDMIDAFEDWPCDLVAKFLEQEGFPDATEPEIAMWHEKINGGFPLHSVRPAMLVLRRPD